MYTDNDFRLYHHGILGQRWGVRRFQKKDGSYTSAGKKRYSEDKKRESAFETRTAKYFSKQYREQGLTKQEADEAGRKKAALMKKVAIGAGIAIGTASAVYVARKLGKEYLDTTIKAGTGIQTVAMDANRMENGKAFYTAFRESDKNKYVGMFGRDASGQYKNVIKAITSGDVKVASPKNGEKVYKSLMNNPDFKNAIRGAEGFAQFDRGKTDYENFNTWVLLGNNENSRNAQKMFYASLKSMGYQGVVDVNDRKYSGFNTLPVIMFDNSKLSRDVSGNLRKNVERLTENEYVKKQGWAYSRLAAEAVRDKVISPSGVAGASAIVGAHVLSKADREAMERHEANARNRTGKRR